MLTVNLFKSVKIRIKVTDYSPNTMRSEGTDLRYKLSILRHLLR